MADRNPRDRGNRSPAIALSYSRRQNLSRPFTML